MLSLSFPRLLLNFFDLDLSTESSSLLGKADILLTFS